MRKGIIILVLCFCCAKGIAQETQTTEQQIENITEVNESETEDDSYLQTLRHYQRNKLNLNSASETELKEFTFLSPLQIANFLSYRRLFGKFISIYELQSIPTWDNELIQKILPFVMVGPAISMREDVGRRLRDGEHTILSRITYVLEESKGFKRRRDTSATSFYPGSRERFLLRYKYVYRNLLQYGITAEKDPGEQWFKGAQRNGFDYYSAHFFVRNVGIIKNLAIGDYTVNMGQGLIQWQSLAFKKNVDVINTKRQASILRPFNSTNEYFFNRGAAITLEKNRFQVTGFASFRKVSGNLTVDTLNAEDYFSSLVTSGLHRTPNEQADKNAVQMNSFGGNVSYNDGNLHIGANAVYFQFNKPLQRDDQPYNNFAFNGKQLTNMSVDWSYTWRNMHWYGELANHNRSNYGMMSGLLISADPKVDLSFVYRDIQKGYQSIFGNAFTEGTFPTNEKGLFTGASIKPNAKWKLDAYMDFYRFPYLRFRIDAPSNGQDYLVQLTHRPNKQIEIYTRFRQESKALNYTDDGELVTALVEPVIRRNWRTQIQYKVSPSVTLRQRLDVMWYDVGGPLESRGFLAFFDVFYKPQIKPLSANIRLQYFETDDFNSRIYAYENDVLYGFSIPPFADKGYRYYLNVNYDLSKKLTFWVRWAQFIYRNRMVIGSGLDEIAGNQRSEVKVQILWRL
ncbi:ComEA family DNA-binding protein [Lacibacter sediminis]|uniref:Helix-hairpin-helix domain-containing protein n=1 Tax=Lacibacter sediminis TaxID=2760713 RepID=A0A7G5XJX5_9BACT|nr:helix-hairpin-helix domain-containing protein [Lacibacter sediminis]QNA45778.1 helix-hairpin-helix domain-containing protein [Lacibacter sediminis]